MGRTPGHGVAILTCATVLVAGCLRPIEDVPADAAAAEDVAASELRFGGGKDATGPAVPDAATDDLAEDATATDVALDLAVAVTCGDGACAGGETCSGCPADCGACPPVCNPVTSAGCAAADHCFPNPDGPACAPAGTKAHATACIYWNECVKGALCVAGLCRTVCDASGKDAVYGCKPGVPCETIVFEGAGEVGANLGACKPPEPCDPMTDAGCPAGKACTPAGWMKSCTPVGSQGAGEPCGASGACKAGLLCADTGKLEAGKAKICRAKCRTDGKNPVCAAGSCVAVLGPDGGAIPEFVGTCAEP